MLHPVVTLNSIHSLVAATRDGDTGALGRLYTRYANLVYAAAYRVIGSASDAEDVLQDVFVGLPEALHAYDERGQFEAWLKRVAIRTALMRVRADGRRREDPIDAASTLGRSEERMVVGRLAIRDAIACLPDHLRVVFMLKEVEGYSHAEIATLIGITANASAARLFRAWETIRHGAMSKRS